VIEANPHAPELTLFYLSTSTVVAVNLIYFVCFGAQYTELFVDVDAEMW
jgi:hypothetical protein